MKLSDFASSQAKDSDSDNPAIAEMLKMLKAVKNFRPATRFGKKVYDDKSFSESLMDQYSRRGKLSDRQVGALKRMVRAYRTQIPDYEEKKESLGLEGKESDDAARS